MTRFLDLKKKYDELASAEELYWEDLISVVRELTKEFYHYLQPPEAELNSKKTRVPWLALGRLGLDGFELCKLSDFERVERTLHFALLLNLSVEPTFKPSSQLVLPLRLCKIEDAYQLSSVDGSIYPEPFAQGKYEEIISLLYSRFEQSIVL